MCAPSVRCAAENKGERHPSGGASREDEEAKPLNLNTERQRALSKQSKTRARKDLRKFDTEHAGCMMAARKIMGMRVARGVAHRGANLL